jgi:hypothetical protein
MANLLERGVTAAAISRYQFYSLGAFVVSFQGIPGRFAEIRPDTSPCALQVGLTKRGGLRDGLRPMDNYLRNNIIIDCILF